MVLLFLTRKDRYVAVCWSQVSLTSARLSIGTAWFRRQVVALFVEGYGGSLPKNWIQTLGLVPLKVIYQTLVQWRGHCKVLQPSKPSAARVIFWKCELDHCTSHLFSLAFQTPPSSLSSCTRIHHCLLSALPLGLQPIPTPSVLLEWDRPSPVPKPSHILSPLPGTPFPRIWLTLLIPQGSVSTSHPHKAFPDRWANLTPLFYSTQCFSSECSCHSCSCISSLSNVCFLQQNISCKKLDTESNFLNAVSPASHTALNQW